ncbi:MAG: thymidine kinase [Patescibacteria group bacterium]
MKKKGFIHVTVGPMFSGKSSWLIQEMEDLRKNNVPHLAIRFGNDNRYSTDSIASHDGTTFLAHSAKTIADIEKLLKKFPDAMALGIDEINFFPTELGILLKKLKEKGTQIYVAGLDTDFLAIPWESVTQILKHADIINRLTAICSTCKKKIATRTQRLINGKPASRNSPRILIGASESYTARCEDHHEITN